MKKLIEILIVMALMVVLPGAVYAACTQTLYAGQNTDVGTVTFADNGTVTFTTKNGWVMTETHLHVATSLYGIPQTRQGNPIPGQFKYQKYHNPSVTTVTYDVGTKLCGKPLYIAAHAVVSGYSELQSMTVVSDATTLVMQGNDPSAAYPHNAVAAWEPFDDPVDPTASYWDEETEGVFDGSGADWIWETYRPLHPVDGDIVEFEKKFTVPGKIVSAILDITADNGYEVKLNGQLIGSAQLFGDWRTPLFCAEDNKYMFLRDPIFDGEGNVIVPGVERYGWKSIEEYDAVGTSTTENIACGRGKNKWHKHGRFWKNQWHERYNITGKCTGYGGNVLHITVANEAMSSETICGYTDQGFDGTVDDNPAGLIYKLAITYTPWGGTKQETAWAGGNKFPGKNWATYFICTIPCN